MKVPAHGALRFALAQPCRRLYGTLPQVHCFLEIALTVF